MQMNLIRDKMNMKKIGNVYFFNFINNKKYK